jgi:hypothetical protein
VNTEHNDGSAVDWGTGADPILSTPLWRPETSQPPQVIAAAAADPHEHDWAGPGFTKPGPEPDTGHRAGHAPGNPEARADVTTLSDGPATSLAGRRYTPGPVRQMGAEGRNQ